MSDECTQTEVLTADEATNTDKKYFINAEAQVHIATQYNFLDFIKIINSYVL